MKRYESVEFLSIFECQTPPQKRKDPFSKLSGDGSVFSIAAKNNCRDESFKKFFELKRNAVHIVTERPQRQQEVI